MHKKLLEQVIKETQLQLADVSYEPAKKDSEEVNYLKQHIKYLDDQVKSYKLRAEELAQSLKQREIQVKEFKAAHQQQVESLMAKSQNRLDQQTQTEAADMQKLAQTLAKTDAMTQTLSEFGLTQESASLRPESVSASHQSVDTIKSISQMKFNLKDLEQQRDQLHAQLKTQDTALKNLREQNRTLNTQLDMLKQKQQDEGGQMVPKTELEQWKNVAGEAKLALEKTRAEFDVKEYELNN